MTKPPVARIGLIADTHDLVRPEALKWLAGCDAIVHAGDICQAAVLDALDRLAPVTAVRGNNDRGAWAEALPVRTVLTVQQVRILVVHDIADLRHEPPGPDIDVVVTGHSHQPRIEQRGAVLYVNPGSAGPRRFRLPISAGLLTIEGNRAQAVLQRLIE